MKSIINTETLMPLSAFAVVGGAIFWLSSVFASVQNNAEAIIEVRESIRATNESRADYRQRLWEAIRSQDKRLAVIEGKLDVIAEIVTKQLEADRAGRASQNRQP